MVRRSMQMGLVLALIVFPSLLQAASQPEIVQLAQKEVAAIFLSTLPQNPCIQISVFVIGRDLLELRPNPGPSAKQIMVQINSFDLCLVAPLVTGNGVANNPNFDVDPVLRSATLNATAVPFLNLANGQLLYVDVNLTWWATGPPQSAGAGNFTPVPGERVTFHGLKRPAVAAGTVVVQPSPPWDGGLGGLNLVPNPSSDAEIRSAETTTIIPGAVSGDASGR